MFGMGMPEILLILALALIVIGPKMIPDLAKSLGKAMGEFKRATSDFKDAIDIEDVKNPLNDIKSSMLDDIEDDDNSSEGLEREDFSEIKDEKSDKNGDKNSDEDSELKTDQKKESE